MSMSEDELFMSSVVPYRILVLCIGNTCRSIMYEAIYKNKFKNKPNIEITSAGFNANEKSISQSAKHVLSKYNIPISKEIPTNTNSLNDLIYDEIIVLDKNYGIIDLKAIKHKKASFYDIEDPKGKSIKVYEDVYSKLANII